MGGRERERARKRERERYREIQRNRGGMRQHIHHSEINNKKYMYTGIGLNICIDRYRNALLSV